MSLQQLRCDPRLPIGAKQVGSSGEYESHRVILYSPTAAGIQTSCFSQVSFELGREIRERKFPIAEDCLFQYSFVVCPQRADLSTIWTGAGVSAIDAQTRPFMPALGSAFQI